MPTDPKFKAIRRATFFSRLYWRLRRIASGFFPWAFTSTQTNSIELFKKDGPTSSRTSLRWGENFVELRTFDTGEMPAKIFGGKDYEFWTRVERPAFSALVQALGAGVASDNVEILLEHLTTNFHGRNDATSTFEKFCIEHKIAHQSDNWISGDGASSNPPKG